jgi:hypothetical protein
MDAPMANKMVKTFAQLVGGKWGVLIATTAGRDPPRDLAGRTVMVKRKDGSKTKVNLGRLLSVEGGKALYSIS